MVKPRYLWISFAIRGRLRYKTQCRSQPKLIEYGLARDGVEQISVKPVSGTIQEESLYKSEEMKIPDFWTSDGRCLVYTAQKELQDTWMLPLGRDGKPSGPPKPFAKSGQAQLSPDGRWVVDTSTESGLKEIWVRSFPDGNTKLLLSKGGGVEPWWQADGKEISTGASPANWVPWR